ncbi:MAG: PAS domain S-box protein [Thermodesulfovibrionaceae bacterium]
MIEKNSFPDWQQVFDSILDLVVFLKPDGTIFYCNQRFAEFVNKDCDSIFGQKCHELVHGAEGFLEDCPLIRSLKSGKRETWELKEGEKYFYIVVDPIKDKEGKIVGFIHILHDITEQKKAEEALKESLERYKYISELISDYAYAFSVTPQGELIGEWITDSFTKVFGFTKEEIDQRGGWKSMVYPEDLPIALEHAKKVVNGHSDIAEFRFVTRTGEVRWLRDYAIPYFDKSGRVVRIYGAAQDITEKKKLLEELKESEEKYKTIVENAGEAIVILQDGMIKYANPKAIEKSGYTEEELLSKPFTEFIHPDDRQIAMELHLGVLKEGKEHPPNYPLRIIGKQGNIIWVEVNAALVTWEGKPAELNLIRDITDLKKAEEEKESLYKQLLHAQKMEAIGRLTAGIAHDFNNILTSIKGFTQLSLLKLSENEPLKRYLENVLFSAEKAEKLIQQMLAFCRKQILDLKVININDLIRSMEEMIKRMIGEDIVLSLNLSKDIGLVKADLHQIENAIVNLLVNARDAMPQGGILTVETANVEIDEEFAKKHPDVKAGKYVMLSIADTGVGISDEIKDRIFEPFFSTKEDGTGLGLSTVYGIVKQHNGHILVESKPTKGSTFTIYLPRLTEEVEAEILERLEGKILRGDETVLVIDDDEKVRATVLEMLKRLGYKTLEANNQDTALFLAQFYDKPIDLIICDVVMPGISGTKLINKIKNYRPDVKVLYMSGYTDDVVSKHGILEKGINFIQKPFSIEAFSRKIREVLDKKD